MTAFADMNKAALRTACKEHRISYGGMSNEQMRAALEGVAAAAAEAAEAERVAVETRAAELAAMGEYGAGEEGNAACPHCGIDHTDNGFSTPDDEGMRNGVSSGKTLHEMGEQHAEFHCLGCGGEWGAVRAPYSKPSKPSTRATGTGLKIEKDRVQRNGIKQPSVGGACRSVWDACTEMQALTPDTPLAVKQVKAHAVTMGWNENNAVIEFYRWRKWAAPTAEELAAVDADLNEEGDPQDGAPEVSADELADKLGAQ